jgi:thiamine-monophosphate kinase
MKLSALGEHGLIELFKKEFRKRDCKDLLASIGDDCAVIGFGSGECLLVSTDTVLQKTHIPREMTPEQIGGYAVNVVLSDIAAMGGRPMGLVFSIALPSDLDEDFARKLARGMEFAAEEHETCIVGGDTQKASEIAITGTALGRVKEEKLLLRNGASLGDLICTTGELGSAAAGFYCLIKKIDSHPKFIKKALEPKARLPEGKILSEYASSCMDISDGLALTIHQITGQSKVGSRTYEENIPINHGLKEIGELSGVSTRQLVFYKGGDFELLFTITPEKFEKVQDLLKDIGSEATIIGEITDSGNIVVDKNGGESVLENRGWQAFSGDIFLSSL